MRKKEQTGINLSEEEILHGKEDAYGITISCKKNRTKRAD